MTICTHDREHFFGEVRNEKMVLSDMGSIVYEEWCKTPEIRKSISLTLEVSCVMPNHFHALLLIGDPELPSHYGRFLATNAAPAKFGGAHSQTLGAIVRGFKGSCTNRIHRAGFSDFRWQPRFHNHIVRDHYSFLRIRQYILDNPRRWQGDRFYDR
ncbi:MAG: transposase [Tunicatimonas sp.]